MMDCMVFQDRNLPSLGGLLLFKELLAGSRLDERVGEALPSQWRASGASGFDKFRALLLVFFSGAECLEDMDRLRSDPMFREVNGTLVGSTTYGDYLRRMSLRQGQGTNRRTESPFLFTHEEFPYLSLMVRINSPHMPGRPFKGELFLHQFMRRPGAAEVFRILGISLGLTKSFGDSGRIVRLKF
jgi:hypothetical protein